MINYSIYKSDPTKTKFEWVGDAETEIGGRKNICAYIQNNFLDTEFKHDKIINLYLFKGSNNISGILITSITVSSHNTKSCIK